MISLKNTSNEEHLRWERIAGLPSKEQEVYDVLMRLLETQLIQSIDKEVISDIQSGIRGFLSKQ